MLPPRNDIPVPIFPPGMQWSVEEPPAAERLTAKGPLLVHFFEAGELSSVQSLPHVAAWAERYREAGLSTIGVHSPRSSLARGPAAFTGAIDRLGVPFPVVNDDAYRAWHAYGCKGWPSLFLWGRGGMLRWFHFGIGGIDTTEEAIRTELQAGDSERELPERVHPEPDSGQRGEKMAKPSDEVFPGGSHDSYWTGKKGEPLEIEYAGAGAWAALDGEGSVRATDESGTERGFELDGPGLYEVAAHNSHGIHEVSIQLEGNIRVWSVAFAPGAA